MIGTRASDVNCPIAPAGPRRGRRRSGCAPRTARDQDGMRGQGGEQGIRPHPPLVHRHRHQGGPELRQGGDDSRIGGGLDRHRVARPDPAGGGHADGLLPAGADDDLIGLGGQAPVGDAGGQGRPERGQAPGAVARRRLHRRQVGGRHADIVQAAGVVRNGEREIDEIARGVAAFDQVVHEDTALATGGQGAGITSTHEGAAAGQPVEDPVGDQLVMQSVLAAHVRRPPRGGDSSRSTSPSARSPAATACGPAFHDERVPGGEGLDRGKAQGVLAHVVDLAGLDAALGHLEDERCLALQGLTNASPVGERWGSPTSPSLIGLWRRARRTVTPMTVIGVLEAEWQRIGAAPRRLPSYGGGRSPSRRSDRPPWEAHEQPAVAGPLSRGTTGHDRGVITRTCGCTI